MWSKYYVLLGGFLLINAVGKFQCYGALDKQFPLGTIGCLFTDPEKLCGADVTCIDDLLFGTCPTAGVPDNFVYTLNEHDMKKLWQELDKLVIAGYKWSDGYTQCITQNVILSLTIQEPFSKKLCNQHIFDWEKDVKDEITSTLGKLYKRTMDFNQLTSEQSPMDELPLLTANSQKRDEIVRVHKYFDKSKGIIKRKSNYLTYDPQDDLYGFNQGLYAQNYVDPSANEYRDTSIDLPWDDLLLVKSYLEEMQGKEQQRHRTKLSDLLALGSRQPEPEDGLYGLYPGSAYDIEPSVGSDVEPEIMNQEPGYLWSNEGSELYNLPPSTEEEALETMDLPEDPLSEELGSVVESSTEDLINSLPPQYANTLDKLIKGELVPENLTDDELDYLMPYVTKMLLRLSEEIQEGETTQDPLEATVEKALEMDMEAQDERIPFGVEEEDMEMGGRDSGLTDGAADRDQAVEEEDMGDMMEKKSAADDVNEAVAEEEKNEDVVDTNYAFVEMDQPLTEEKADQLVEALQKIVSANPNSLNNYLVQGKKVYIDVDPMRAGFNASVVAQQATDHKVDLEAATGLKFVTSGIGHENEVPIKSTENRYFELTFVLCGCIAGILLAVVVVYLIRRNSRSKEKLKQIAASNQDGNEAASKDYQDLCRQRMQSKSSEKPEPLHAASRVGSVSESQVRSPSSRSSTSSCKMDLKYKKRVDLLNIPDRSEEPVNSNMDISTGHIVLSYMEDHLKNKDRLEREWDAMCAYEADPASTKMAQDPANTRKNRYGDVLPYDHSRVVLSNVSGSDYINASTITDHDPRNPAYIATQGPQPHTVAEFWQMVWEQGSVVIVMLTKLTETGEAKCHRYWPEEGSDLYHIYEVHLVSEHIWCDDYLVRSFYLKNLQTSETRTVTQFHFLTWPDLGVPSSIKALLDFRRKVNKSYRGRSCPIVVHCSDGCGRTGTYTLVDMVLNRMAKGAKEIDIAATLEHIRDQRMNMVKTKEQFQFALAAVAEEVHAILKALPQ